MTTMKNVTDFARYLTRFFSEYLAGVRNLSKNTIMAYRDTFRLLFKFCKDENKTPPEKLTIKRINETLIIRYLDWLQKERKCSISTRNQRLAGIHSFFRYLQAQEPEYLFLCRKILLIPFKKAPKTIVRHLTIEQTALLLKQPDRQAKKGRRDLVLLSVLYDTGARVQEVCDLRVKDIRLERPPLITLTGKGCKSRYVPLMRNTANLLQIYMQENGLSRNDKPDAPLFYSQKYRALTRGGITHILQKYVDKALCLTRDMPSKATPHVLRHSKAVHLLQAGINIIVIRDIMGHTSVKTTEMYTKVDMETKREALEKSYTDIVSEELPDWNRDEKLLDFLQST